MSGWVEYVGADEWPRAYPKPGDRGAVLGVARCGLLLVRWQPSSREGFDALVSRERLRWLS